MISIFLKPGKGALLQADVTARYRCSPMGVSRCEFANVERRVAFLAGPIFPDR